MSSKILDILQQKIKPKQKVNQLTDALKSEKISLDEVLSFYEEAKDSHKGACMQAIELVVEENPEFIEDKVDFFIEQLSYDAPKVKWEAAEILSLVAGVYSEQVAAAVPALIENAKHKGTVVRWSAALALTRIAEFNQQIRRELLPKFRQMIDREDNNGVKKFYIKALKEFANN